MAFTRGRTDKKAMPVHVGPPFDEGVVAGGEASRRELEIETRRTQTIPCRGQASCVVSGEPGPSHFRPRADWRGSKQLRAGQRRARRRVGGALRGGRLGRAGKMGEGNGGQWRLGQVPCRRICPRRRNGLFHHRGTDHRTGRCDRGRCLRSSFHRGTPPSFLISACSMGLMVEL